MTDRGPFQNTDREIWSARPGDYYADSIHVTDSGAIGINVGGHVVVMPARDWHALAHRGVDEVRIALDDAEHDAMIAEAQALAAEKARNAAEKERDDLRAWKALVSDGDWPARLAAADSARINAVKNEQQWQTAASAAEKEIERLKAENASLLESLRAAEEAIRLRDANDNGLFMEAFRARERAREAEQNYAGAKELIEAGKTDYRWLLAQARAAGERVAAAEQRAEAAEKRAEQYERDWYAAKSEFGDAMAKTRALLRAAKKRSTDLMGALRGLLDCAGFDWHGGAEVDASVEQAVNAARAALHDEERSAPPQEALAEIAAGWPAKHAGEPHAEDVVASAASAAQPPPEFCCDIRAVYGHGVHRTGCPGAQGEEK